MKQIYETRHRYEDQDGPKWFWDLGDEDGNVLNRGAYYPMLPHAVIDAVAALKQRVAEDGPDVHDCDHPRDEPDLECGFCRARALTDAAKWRQFVKDSRERQIKARSRNEMYRTQADDLGLGESGSNSAAPDDLAEVRVEDGRRVLVNSQNSDARTIPHSFIADPRGAHYPGCYYQYCNLREDHPIHAEERSDCIITPGIGGGDTATVHGEPTEEA